jgi:hypothetical protein
MAYSDPQSATVATVVTSLPRINSGSVVGKFISADNSIELDVDPRGTAKRRRSSAKLYVRPVVTDPITGLARQEQFMVSVTIDRPTSGVTDAVALDALKALVGWGTASTDSNFKKLIAGEN